MATIKTRTDVELYVKDWGRGRAVVLIHGWPLSADTFDDLGRAIANAGMRAIAYDRRGFGRSDQPWSGYDYDSLSDDLADVIAATGASRPTLIGFSMGGGEVARYLARQPNHEVVSAVLIGAVLPYLLKTADNPDGVDQAVFSEMSERIHEDRAAFWATFFPQFYGVGMMSRPVSAEVVEWSQHVAMQASLEATLACVQAFATTDFRNDLSAFRVPTLLIHGTSDKTVPIDASARRAVAGIRGSTLIEYDGAPHGVLASHKAEIARDVLAFLERVRG